MISSHSSSVCRPATRRQAVPLAALRANHWPDPVRQHRPRLARLRMAHGPRPRDPRDRSPPMTRHLVVQPSRPTKRPGKPTSRAGSPPHRVAIGRRTEAERMTGSSYATRPDARCLYVGQKPGIQFIPHRERYWLVRGASKKMHAATRYCMRGTAPSANGATPMTARRNWYTNYTSSSKLVAIASVAVSLCRRQSGQSTYKDSRGRNKDPPGHSRPIEP